jgi:RNA polymerase sigma-70 factor (ECF subfamily)
MGVNWKITMARVTAALMRRGRTAHEAEDLVQEAWVRFASHESEQEIERPEAYVMKIALNLSINSHRERVSHGEEVMLDDVVLIDLRPSIEATLLARERMLRLSEGVARLSAKTRAILLANRVDGMTYQEIAQCHGLSTSTVEKHIAKALFQLTTWMEGW